MILIVDDHFDTGSALARLLNKCGHEAVAVGSGAAALRLMEMIRPRVIVLDMQMPDMHGLEVLEQVRSGRAVRDVPVVVYTADTDYGTMRKALGLGAQEFIVKGTVGWADVCDTIARYCAA